MSTNARKPAEVAAGVPCHTGVGAQQRTPASPSNGRHSAGGSELHPLGRLWRVGRLVLSYWRWRWARRVLGGLGRLTEQRDSGRQGLADVEATGALAVVPVESVPVGSVARTVWRTVLTRRLATADVLLPVDDAGRPHPRRPRSTSRSQGHTQSLHKTPERRTTSVTSSYEATIPRNSHLELRQHAVSA